jgi:hypothetical protein
MNRRIFILVGAGGAVLAVVVLVVLGLRGGRTNTPNINISLSNTNSTSNANTSDANANTSDAALRQRTVDFSERVESGPSGSENLRLLSLRDFLTPNLVVFAEAQARKPAPKSDGSVVAGKALTIEYSETTATRTVATVEVQRTVSYPATPTKQPVVNYITVTLTFQKIDGEWKVASVVEGPIRTL